MAIPGLLSKIAPILRPISNVLVDPRLADLTPAEIMGVVRGVAREAGIAAREVRQGEVMAVVRAATEIREAGVEMNAAALDTVPDVRGLPESLRAQPKQFSVRIKGLIRDPETGELIEQYITVINDDPITPRQAYDTAFRQLANYPDITEDDIEDLQIVEYTRAPLP